MLTVSVSGISKTIFSPSDPNVLCNRFRLLLQELKAGKNSNLVNQENVAIADKLLENKCISKKQLNETIFFSVDVV